MVYSVYSPSEVYPNASQVHPRSRGPRGHALRPMAGILDLMPLFGFGFRDVICAKEGPILLATEKVK